jgi:hypothetical protein
MRPGLLVGAEQHGGRRSGDKAAADEAQLAMRRGTRPDRYIGQPSNSPFPTPTQKPGPSRNVRGDGGDEGDDEEHARDERELFPVTW